MIGFLDGVRMVGWFKGLRVFGGRVGVSRMLPLIGFCAGSRFSCAKFALFHAFLP